MSVDVRKTANEVLKLLRRITPEQWERAKPLIMDVIAKQKAGTVRLIRGGKPRDR
jgi:hypothetical protein